MGNCTKSTKNAGDSQGIEYTDYAELSIKKKNHLGRIRGSEEISINLTRPVSQRADVVLLDGVIKVSACVIPGLCPHGETKICQDAYTYILNENLLLCAIFDGHGDAGDQISSFCTSFTKTFFLHHSSLFSTNPQAALTKMLEDCDSSLLRSSINTELSGTTAAVLLLTPTQIHTASLGDSRVLLASLGTEPCLLPSSKTRFCRPLASLRNLKPVPLTIDQKPNHEEEFKRIKEAGGVVEKITDIMGHSIGPFRVWKGKSEVPGIAMSRSLGDRIAKTVGVISTPVYHEFNLYAATDQFIIIASDGVWDVMENLEVVAFVDQFISRCQGCPQNDAYPAGYKNSTIARMLCEEARYRWLGLIEEEDVSIDDISCIVLDLQKKGVESIREIPERNVKLFQSLSLDGRFMENDSD